MFISLYFTRGLVHEFVCGRGPSAWPVIEAYGGEGYSGGGTQRGWLASPLNRGQWGDWASQGEGP